MQEAFIRGWEPPPPVRRPGTAPDAWIRTVARRLAVSRWRAAQVAALAAWRRHGPPARTSPGPGVDTPLVVVGAAAGSPTTSAAPSCSTTSATSPSTQVAEEVGAPTGTVKARLSRGRAALRQIIGGVDETRGLVLSRDGRHG